MRQSNVSTKAGNELAVAFDALDDLLSKKNHSELPIQWKSNVETDSVHGAAFLGGVLGSALGGIVFGTKPTEPPTKRRRKKLPR